MFVWPHGIRVDRDGFLWITDGRARNGIGQQVFKFTRDGQLLMTLGKKGVSGDGPDTFNSPTDVAVAPNGDIFVADGHVNSRIVKFSKDGKFIKTWGKKGSAPGDFDVAGPHALAMDSRGRLFVGDRGNNRILIFDQDGTLLDTWYQFSRPSGIWIDARDTIYVADSESGSVAPAHGAWTRGIRVGSARTGVVTALIPDPAVNPPSTSAAEGVAVDARGVIYGAEVGPRALKRYERIR